MSNVSKLAAFFRSLVGRFALSNRGNVALIFAVTLVPMLAATGMVVDYTRAALARQQLQDALDSTALFLSKNPSVSTMNQATLLSTAQTYFNVNFTNTDVGTTTIVPTYTATGPAVTVSGTTSSPCVFMGIVGVRSIPVSGTATAIWGEKRLRVALVLDNTTSMNSSGKMTALKAATHTLLTQLQNAATVPQDVYVSIVPFVEDVKVDPTNYSQSWIQFDGTGCSTTPSGTNCDKWWDGFNGTCSITSVTHSPRSVCVTLGTCSISTYNNNKSGCLTAGTCSISTYNNNQSGCSTAGTCNVTSKTTQSTCTAAFACYVSGTYNATYTTSATCTANGTCSNATYNNNQSGCLAIGTCNITSKTTQSTCTGASACFQGTTYVSTYTTSSTCTAAGVCTITSKTTSSACTGASGCFISGTYTSTYTTSGNCTSHGGTWKAGVWTADTWKAGTWTSTPGTWTQTGVSGTGAWTAATWTAATWTNAVWTPSAHSTWGGCVMDRGSWTAPGTTAGDDQQLYSTTYPSAFPADQTSYCPQTMVGLTNVWTTLSSVVDGMSPNGYTNQPIGLVWGWQSLIGSAGLTVPAYQTPYQYQLVIILLSDGVNTQDRWYMSSNTNAPFPSVDNRMYYSSGGTISGTCKNVKDAGITLYTVQVDTDGSGLSTLLQNCASDTSKFFRLTSSTQIVTTFQTIGTALSQLRLSN